MDPSLAAAWMIAAIPSLAGLGLVAERCFPDFAPEGTGNPCLIYQLLDDEDEGRLDRGAAEAGTHSFQIRIYAGSRREANALREAFRQGFENLEPGPMPGWTLEGTGWAKLADTYDPETKDYGALGILTVHGTAG